MQLILPFCLFKTYVLTGFKTSSRLIKTAAKQADRSCKYLLI